MAVRQYELIYILPPDTTDEQAAEVHALLEPVVARMQGHIEKTENWGRRRLAYEIRHFKEGVYVLEVIKGDGALVHELDRRLKVTEGLLRHLIVRVDEDQLKAERARNKRTEESRRRRIARGLPPDRQPGEGPQTDESDDSGDDYMEVEA